MKKTNESKTSICKFKLLSVKKVKFFEDDPQELNLGDLSNKEFGAKILPKVTINAVEKLIEIILDISMNPADSPESKIFGIKTITAFQINNFNEIIKTDSADNREMPIDVLKTFMSIAYSTTRGMLVVLLTNDAYKSIYLPIIDPGNLLKN